MTASTKPRSLDEWLAYQLNVHALGVDLGLERVRAVWQRMGAPHIAKNVITVGGTNGKGSTVAFLEAMLTAGGHRVGCYVSPHLLEYNERIRVDGVDASDELLTAAFETIELARCGPVNAIPLTYFEFGTLAALWIFSKSGLDVAVLEVGLGGRLDAVNIIDADAMIVTTIALDHQDWLGSDLDSIGREKAGIFRARKPAIIGAQEAPAGLLESAAAIGAEVIQAGVGFKIDKNERGWCWSNKSVSLDLPNPALAGAVQRHNAAAAIAALYSLRSRIGWDGESIAMGVASARAPARLQRFEGNGEAEWIVDVAHNPQAAGVLAEWLARTPTSGRTFAVFGALNDKDVAGIVKSVGGQVQHWYIGGLADATPRGLTAQQVITRADFAMYGSTASADADVESALRRARADAGATDRVICFGSFFVAAAALRQVDAWKVREVFSPAA